MCVYVGWMWKENPCAVLHMWSQKTIPGSQFFLQTGRAALTPGTPWWKGRTNSSKWPLLLWPVKCSLLWVPTPMLEEKYSLKYQRRDYLALSQIMYHGQQCRRSKHTAVCSLWEIPNSGRVHKIPYSQWFKDRKNEQRPPQRTPTFTLTLGEDESTNHLLVFPYGCDKVANFLWFYQTRLVVMSFSNHVIFSS